MSDRFMQPVLYRPALQGEALRRRILEMAPECTGIPYQRAVYDAQTDTYVLRPPRGFRLLRNSFMPVIRCRILDEAGREHVEVRFDGTRVLTVAWWLFTAVFWTSAAYLLLRTGADRPGAGLLFFLFGAGAGASLPLLSLRSVKRSLRRHLEQSDVP